jgi:hypothetical protein
MQEYHEYFFSQLGKYGKRNYKISSKYGPYLSAGFEDSNSAAWALDNITSIYLKTTYPMNFDVTKVRLHKEDEDGVVSVSHRYGQIAEIKLLPVGYLQKEREVIRTEKRKAETRSSFTWAFIWLVIAIFLQWRSGTWNPINGISILWDYKHTHGELIGHKIESIDTGYEPGVYSDEYYSKYKYYVNGKIFKTVDNSPPLSDNVKIRYMPSNPSMAIVESGDSYSATMFVFRKISIRLIFLIIPLIISFIYFKSGIQHGRMKNI